MDIPKRVVDRRVKDGWPIERAMTEPICPGGTPPWRRKSPAERFWAKVRKGEDCWWWIGGRRSSRQEYGQFKPSPERGSVPAHVYSFELHHGRAPKGLVMHTCNNPACVNPAHLEEGTCKNNLEYAASLGRMAHGSRNGSAKLTEEQVRDIFLRYKRGDAPQTALAKEFGVSQPVVSEIVRRVKWQRATEGL